MNLYVFNIAEWKVKINRSKYRSSDSLTLDFNALLRTIDNLVANLQLIRYNRYFFTFSQKVCGLACGKKHTIIDYCFLPSFNVHA